MNEREKAEKSEIQQLKKELKYISWEQDEDYLLSDLDRLIFSDNFRLEGESNKAVPVVVTTMLLEQWYYENNALEPLAMIYKKHHWPIARFVQKILDHTSSVKRWDFHEKVLRGILAATIRRFFDRLPERKRYPGVAGVLEESECRKVWALYLF